MPKGMRVHAAGFLNIEEVDKYALGGFGAQIYIHGAFGRGSHLGAEHEIELTHFGPVLVPDTGHTI